MVSSPLSLPRSPSAFPPSWYRVHAASSLPALWFECSTLGFLFCVLFISIPPPFCSFYLLLLCPLHSWWLFLVFFWFSQEILSLPPRIVTASSSAWVSFPFQQSDWCHIYYQGFSWAWRYFVCFYWFLVLVIWVPFWGQWPAHRHQYGFWASCFSSNVPCLKLHPFSLPVLSTETLTYDADPAAYFYFITFTVTLMGHSERSFLKLLNDCP